MSLFVVHYFPKDKLRYGVQILKTQQGNLLQGSSRCFLTRPGRMLASSCNIIFLYWHCFSLNSLAATVSILVQGNDPGMWCWSSLYIRVFSKFTRHTLDKVKVIFGLTLLSMFGDFCFINFALHHFKTIYTILKPFA